MGVDFKKLGNMGLGRFLLVCLLLKALGFGVQSNPNFLASTARPALGIGDHNSGNSRGPYHRADGPAGARPLQPA